ncbi:MAG: nuclear transport factor 2 family protein [Gemmatimonadota bacterium]
MRRAGLLIAMALLALPATALAQADEYSKSSLKEMPNKWQAAYNAGDAASLAALYAEDGVLHPPNSAPVDGREAIQAFWATALESGGTSELTVKDMFAMGESAAEVGMWVGTAADGSHADHGHYTIIYKKVDGMWQIASDMWNSDMSP